MKDIHDVIKHAKFGDDRFRGSGWVAGQISAFPIDFAGRPYNTLTLPCERVIPDKILDFQLSGFELNGHPELVLKTEGSVQYQTPGSHPKVKGELVKPGDMQTRPVVVPLLLTRSVINESSGSSRSSTVQ